MGYNSIIYLSAISGIDAAIYEAAMLMVQADFKKYGI